MHPNPHTAHCAYSFRAGGGEWMEMGLKDQVEARSKGAFTPYCMWLYPASHKEGRPTGPHGGRIPKGLRSSGPANAMPRPRPASGNIQAPPSMMPCGPLPCSLPSEMNHKSALPLADLFLQLVPSPLLGAAASLWHKHPNCQSSDPHVAQSP